MLYKGVNIFACKIFTVDKDSGAIKFHSGQFRGKTAFDFQKLTDLQKVFAYCFWILNNATFPPVSKYCAAAFLKDLAPKLVELENKLNEFNVSDQQRLAEETEELAKTTGTKYI